MDKRLLEKLQTIAGEKDPLKKSLTVLAILTEALRPDDIRPILVGGRALEFYTLGGYATKDMDLVINGRSRAIAVLEESGFLHRPGERHWYHEELDLALEIPGEYLAGSLEKVVLLEIEDLECYIIGIEDLIVDRLAAAKFWKSLSDGQWAAKLIALHHNDIDGTYLKEAATKAGVEDVLETAWRQGHKYLQE